VDFSRGPARIQNLPNVTAWRKGQLRGQGQNGFEQAIGMLEIGVDLFRPVAQEDRGARGIGEKAAHDQALLLVLLDDVRAKQPEWVAIFGPQQKGNISIEFADRLGLGRKLLG
jgi:hypothetical protein